MPREPRGAYLSPLMAGVRMIQLAIEKIFEVREGYKIKWTATISYQDEHGAWSHTASFRSGEVDG